MASYSVFYEIYLVTVQKDRNDGFKILNLTRKLKRILGNQIYDSACYSP